MKPQVTVIGNSGACPDALNLARFAAGTLDDHKSQSIIQHLADCAECGARLRLIAAPDEDDLTPEELALIGNLPSARPAGRAALARRMSERRVFGPAMRIAAAITGVGFILGGMWYARQNGRAAPEQIVARAYSSRRPFAYRLTSGGSPGPVKVDRSATGLTNLPGEVVDALTSLDGAVVRRPDDPQLLSALGQVKLLAFDVDEATAALEHAHRLDPADERITANLATALALHSDRVEAGEPNRPLMARSLQLLDEALQRRPSDTVARFNRALVLKAFGQESEAAAELRRCLQDEPDAAWREEIARQLNGLHK